MSYQIPNEDKLQKHIDEEHYVKPVKNANLKILIAPKLIMVAFWTVLIILFYYPLRSSVSNKYIYKEALTLPKTI